MPGIEWTEGWPMIEAVIHRMISSLEAGAPCCISANDYMSTYRLVYEMCTQHPPREYSRELYESYLKSIEGYALTLVLPALVGKHGEVLLREFVRKWSNHNELVRQLFRLFQYLDRFYVVKKRLLSLNVTGLHIFRDAVYKKIHEEREGTLIDGALLKNVLDIYVSMGAGSIELYEQDFEKWMLSDTAAYYSQKSGKWISACSFSDYMCKVNECMKQEEERAFRYFQNCSKQKLLELVHHLLFVVHPRQAEERRQLDLFASEEGINQWLVLGCERLAI